LLKRKTTSNTTRCELAQGVTRNANWRWKRLKQLPPDIRLKSENKGLRDPVNLKFRNGKLARAPRLRDCARECGTHFGSRLYLQPLEMRWPLVTLAAK
jgi:hypothetical protein